MRDVDKNFGRSRSAPDIDGNLKFHGNTNKFN